jgi:hypothetical protein
MRVVTFGLKRAIMGSIGCHYMMSNLTVCDTVVGAGVDSVREQEKPEARKMLENGTEIPGVQCTRCRAV